MAKSKYVFLPYDYSAIASAEGIKCLWRHDIDYSIDQSLELARIDADCGIVSTFFIHLHAEFYSFFEKEQKDKVREILDLGMKVGLHFDFGFYTDSEEKCTFEMFEDYARYEKDVLRKILGIGNGVELPISFHNPELLGITELKADYFADSVNVCSKHIFDNFYYCSDSNGYWRFKRLEDVLRDEDVKDLQVLITHPGWWQKKIMLPSERIKNMIDKRAENTYKNYCDMLEQGKRKNI